MAVSSGKFRCSCSRRPADCAVDSHLIVGHDLETSDPSFSFLTHLHRLVGPIVGGADEPARVLHRLKRGQRPSFHFLGEQEAICVFILTNLF